MQLQVPVSVGEVLDKITILQIKLAHISDANKRVNIQNELDALLPLMAGDGFTTDEMQGLMAELKSVNEALWDIEDDIREKEAAKSYQRWRMLKREETRTQQRQQRYSLKCERAVW